MNMTQAMSLITAQITTLVLVTMETVTALVTTGMESPLVAMEIMLDVCQAVETVLAECQD